MCTTSGVLNTMQYYMTIDEQPISPDGVTMEHGKVFNRTYPGPWIGKRNNENTI